MRFGASLWLVCQLGAIVGVPVSLCDRFAEPSAAEPGTRCCPGVAPGQICPMHHAREDGRTCRMCAPHDQTDAALLALFGPYGVLRPARLGNVPQHSQNQLASSPASLRAGFAADVLQPPRHL